MRWIFKVSFHYAEFCKEVRWNKKGEYLLLKKEADEVKGVVFNIQRYSVHDGPGIRTTVFLKGCPLRCSWCSNPESQEALPQIMARDAKCKLCRKCALVCPVNAIRYADNQRIIDWEKCNQCLECAYACPYQAITVSGKYMTVEEVASIVAEDRIFYQNSGGGVTVSGGEPLAQGEFTLRLLRVCKEKGIETALDTCGQVSGDVLERVLPYVDLILYDIKHMDAEQHLRETGVGIEQIQANVLRLAREKIRIWLRVPLISGYNDLDENFAKLAKLGKQIGAEKISLLLYHEWGAGKYPQVGRQYTYQAQVPSPERLDGLTAIIQDQGLTVTIGE
jgi:pyruvate formate lyase activating enzyme